GGDGSTDPGAPGSADDGTVVVGPTVAMGATGEVDGPPERTSWMGLASEQPASAIANEAPSAAIHVRIMPAWTNPARLRFPAWATGKDASRSPDGGSGETGRRTDH